MIKYLYSFLYSFYVFYLNGTCVTVSHSPISKSVCTGNFKLHIDCLYCKTNLSNTLEDFVYDPEIYTSILSGMDYTIFGIMSLEGVNIMVGIVTGVEIVSSKFLLLGCIAMFYVKDTIIQS